MTQCEKNDLRIIATVRHGEISALLSALIEEGIKVEGIGNITKSLEDIYLDIVEQSERGI